MFQDELIIVLSKLFQKNRRKRKHFLTQSEASIALVSKPDKDVTIKLQTTIPYEEKCKSTQQNIGKLNLEAFKNNDKL